MSTKQHPGAYDCYAKLADDEPYFVLRAKDAVAPEVVEEWVKLRTLQPGNVGNPKLAEALICAGRMRAWRLKHMSGRACGCDPGAKHHCDRARAGGPVDAAGYCPVSAPSKGIHGHA